MPGYSRFFTMLFLSAGLTLGSAATMAQNEPPTQLALDAEQVIDGVGVACTGIGGTKDDPKWRAYPVRVEFANKAREYLLGATVTLADTKGAPMFTVSCGGPWLLLKPPDSADYHLEARIIDPSTAPQKAIVKSPARGQIRVILTFPDAG